MTRIAAATPDGLPPLGEVIRSLELAARKSLGQNFILDLNLTRRIARAAGSLDGRSVVEVGPGPGGLTRALLLEGAGRVVAIERDERCGPALAAIAQRYPGRLSLQFEDALNTDWPKLAAALAPERPLIAANLPYNVATRLLIGWLESEPWPPWYRGMVLMFQKEVAQRITATVGTKAYGRLAVIAQWRCRVRLLFTLKPACSVASLGRVTAAAFGQRRKMLRQSLKPLLADTEALLSAAGIEPTLRGEALSVSEFARLAYVLERWPGR
jgi:16S rRNA (adenine1518-N6/adenine1519-N6)-dimethyltransferase